MMGIWRAALTAPTMLENLRGHNFSDNQARFEDVFGLALSLREQVNYSHKIEEMVSSESHGTLYLYGQDCLIEIPK